MLLGTSKIMLSRWFLHLRGLRCNVGSPKLSGRHFSLGFLVLGTLYTGQSTAKTDSGHISFTSLCLSIPSLGFKSLLFVFPVVTSLFLRCLNYLLIPHRKWKAKCLPSQLAAFPWMAFCLKVDSQVLPALGKEFSAIATTPCLGTVNKTHGWFTRCILLNLNFMSSAFHPQI